MKQFKFVFVFSLPIQGILNFFQVYIFSDWEFLKYLVVAIVLDTLLGFIYHWQKKDLSSRAYAMISKKLIIYSAALILSNVVSSVKVQGEPVGCLEWFGTFVCIMLMVREALSIVENIEAISPGFFPKSIITRLKDFDSITGDKLSSKKQK